MTKKGMLVLGITIVGIALSFFGAGYNQFFLMDIGIVMFLFGMTGIMLIRNDILKD